MHDSIKPRFKNILDAITAAKAQLEIYESDATPDLAALKEELESLRMRSGYYFNVENPFYENAGYALPLDEDEVEEVYGNALFNTVLANYLSHYIRELEEWEGAPALEC